MIHSLLFKTPNDSEFFEVCKLIEEYRLDNRYLKKEEFTIVLQQDVLMGFGRLRNFNSFMELCSIGILSSQRNEGIGKALVQHMVQQTTTLPIYVVCIIPVFFERLGFRTTLSYPQAIEEKLHYCTKELVVPEPYVVMVLN